MSPQPFLLKKQDPLLFTYIYDDEAPAPAGTTVGPNN